MIDLTRVIIKRGIRSKFVYGNYVESYQWRSIPGTFSLINVKSLRKLHEWLKFEIPNPYGEFMFQSVNFFKVVGRVSNTRTGIRLKDNRSTLAHHFKEWEKRRRMF